MPGYLPDAVRGEVVAFLSPENLRNMIVFFVAIAAVQAVPGGDAVADAALLALAWYYYGWAGVVAAYQLIDAVITVARAKSEADLQGAAKEFATALVALGTVFLLKKIGERVKEGGGKEPPKQAESKPPVTKRPTWRASELDVGKDLGPDIRSQVSYLNGEEVPYGTPGSVRPDFVTNGADASFEVKNYDVANSSKNLINTVSQQAIQRQANLPAGMEQNVIIDIRGQVVTDMQKNAIIKGIVTNSNGAIDPTSIIFKDN